MAYRVRFYVVLLCAALLFSGCAGPHAYTPDSRVTGVGRLPALDKVDYLSLEQFCDAYDFRCRLDKISGIAELTKGSTVAKVMAGSSVTLIDGQKRKFSPQTKLKDKRIYIPSSLVKFLRDKTKSVKIEKKRPAKVSIPVKKPPVVKGPTIRRIVIDPGHGGKDPGAIGPRGIKEKNIALDVAKRLRNELKRRGNFEIIMTRTSDRFISLWKRSDIANKKKADLFLSIHANAARTKKAKGFEVYFLSAATDDYARAIAAAENQVITFENDTRIPSKSNATLWDLQLTENRAESKELAKIICTTSSKKMGIRNRGVKSARFYVLKGTLMPSVLIEVGFLSNYQEAANLNSSRYRQRMASSIADGVMAYKKKFERTKGFTK